MAEKRCVLVAGAAGVIGRQAALHFAAQPDTEVIGLSRRSDLGLTGVRLLSVDLLNADDARAKLSHLPEVTHVVFGAYLERPTPHEKSEVNVALLRNLLDALEAGSPRFEHITFYQGGKAYGADLGPFKTPAREDDPRLMPPNFYYDQEDFLRARQRGKSWHLTALRPEAVMGYATGNPMNLLMVIAVYAAISRELGLPLRFPGTHAAYQALYQVTSSDILARATDWAGRTPAAHEGIFNITNGDYFRWQHMWPRIARMFGMEAVEPTPTPLATYMPDKAPLWTEMTRKYGLQSTPFDHLVSWGFGDFILNSGFDNITSTIKARRAGFPDCIDTEDMFRELLTTLADERVIPPLAG